MGNWPVSAQRLQERREADSREVHRIKERDRMYPPIERPCGTPGAVYSIVVEGCDLGISVRLPFDIPSSLPAEAQIEMKKALHDAVLPVVERFYRAVWVETLAGKTIDDSGPLPKRWGLLFEKWIRRCWQRGSAPEGIGNIPGWGASNFHMLADEYRWERPSRADCDGWKR